MVIIIRLQRLPWAATSTDIRSFFRNLSIPDGGVHIVGGKDGDAFIAFQSDEDARQGMALDGKRLMGSKVKLLLSSNVEMQRVIDDAKGKPTKKTSEEGARSPLSEMLGDPRAGSKRDRSTHGERQRQSGEAPYGRQAFSPPSRRENSWMPQTSGVGGAQRSQQGSRPAFQPPKQERAAFQPPKQERAAFQPQPERAAFQPPKQERQKYPQSDHQDSSRSSHSQQQPPHSQSSHLGRSNEPGGRHSDRSSTIGQRSSNPPLPQLSISAEDFQQQQTQATYDRPLDEALEILQQHAFENSAFTKHKMLNMSQAQQAPSAFQSTSVAPPGNAGVFHDYPAQQQTYSSAMEQSQPSTSLQPSFPTVSYDPDDFFTTNSKSKQQSVSQDRFPSSNEPRGHGQKSSHGDKDGRIAFQIRKPDEDQPSSVLRGSDLHKSLGEAPAAQQTPLANVHTIPPANLHFPPGSNSASFPAFQPHAPAAAAHSAQTMGEPGPPGISSPDYNSPEKQMRGSSSASQQLGRQEGSRDNRGYHGGQKDAYTRDPRQATSHYEQSKYTNFYQNRKNIPSQDQEVPPKQSPRNPISISLGSAPQPKAAFHGQKPIDIDFEASEVSAQKHGAGQGRSNQSWGDAINQFNKQQSGEEVNRSNQYDHPRSSKSQTFDRSHDGEDTMPGSKYQKRPERQFDQKRDRQPWQRNQDMVGGRHSTNQGQGMPVGGHSRSQDMGRDDHSRSQNVSVGGHQDMFAGGQSRPPDGFVGGHSRSRDQPQNFEPHGQQTVYQQYTQVEPDLTSVVPKNTTTPVSLESRPSRRQALLAAPILSKPQPTQVRKEMPTSDHHHVQGAMDHTDHRFQTDSAFQPPPESPPLEDREPSDPRRSKPPPDPRPSSNCGLEYAQVDCSRKRPSSPSSQDPRLAQSMKKRVLLDSPAISAVEEKPPQQTQNQPPAPQTLPVAGAGLPVHHSECFCMMKVQRANLNVHYVNAFLHPVGCLPGNVKFIRDPVTQQLKGDIFVKCNSLVDCENVLRNMNGKFGIAVISISLQLFNETSPDGVLPPILQAAGPPASLQATGPPPRRDSIEEFGVPSVEQGSQPVPAHSHGPHLQHGGPPGPQHGGPPGPQHGGPPGPQHGGPPGPYHGAPPGPPLGIQSFPPHVPPGPHPGAPPPSSGAGVPSGPPRNASPGPPVKPPPVSVGFYGALKRRADVESERKPEFHVVCIDNLPYETTRDELLEFAGAEHVLECAEELDRVTRKRIGRWFVQLRSKGSLQWVMNRSGHHIGRRRCRISTGTAEEMEDRTGSRPVADAAATTDGLPTAAETCEFDTCVELANLRLNTTVDDILRFFKLDSETNVFRKADTTIAYVELENAEQVVNALNMNGEYMRGRSVTVRSCSKVKMDEYKQQGTPEKKKKPVPLFDADIPPEIAAKMMEPQIRSAIDAAKVGPPGDGAAVHEIAFAPEVGTLGCVVALHGLPTSFLAEDIIELFQPLEITEDTVRVRYDQAGLQTGSCLVGLRSYQDAIAAAQAMNGRMLLEFQKQLQAYVVI